MKRLVFLLLPTIFIAMVALSASAEDTKHPTPLTLQDCLNAAMQEQTDLIVARNNVLIAKNRSSQALSSYLPQLSVQNNAFHIGQGVLNKATNGTALSISQNIFDGGLREANALGARYGVKQNNASLNRTQQTVVYNVTKAYYEMLRSKHLADVADANVKYTESLRDQIQSRADLGDAAKVDVLPVEAQLANAKVNALSAQNAVRTSALALESAIGMTPEAGFDIQDVDKVPDPKVEPMGNYVTTALNSRPDVEETKAGTGVARASLKAARINLYPRPVISAEYQRQIQGGFTTSGTQVVGGIVFDIFNGGANRAAYREAKASQANAQQQEKQVVKDIQTQVENAYLDLTSSKLRLDAGETGLEAAQKNYDAQKERYNQGLATPLDLLNAEVQLVTAQSNMVQARYDYYIAIAEMDYSVGKQGGFNAR